MPTPKDIIMHKFDFGSYREYYEQELGEMDKINTSGWTRFLCPFHDDTNPSFDVNFFQEGAYRCHSCGVTGDIFKFHQKKHGTDFKGAIEYFAKFLGVDVTRAPRSMPKKKKPKIDWNNPDKVYHYKDLDGNIIHETLRFSKPIKTFGQRRPDPKKKGKYIYSLKDIKVIPYNLKAVVESDTVYIVEGEKDVDNLKKFDLVGSCNPMGAGKWPDYLSIWFKGKHIIILPDNDKPGRDHAALVSDKLYSIAKSIKIVALPKQPKGGDFSDWLEAGNIKETLLSLVEGVSPFQNHIDWLNSRHAAIMIAGKFYILNEGKDPLTKHPSITFSNQRDFASRYANRKISNPNAEKKGQPKNIPIATDWITSPDRRQYNGYIFAPGREIPGFYNAWRGFTVEPKMGDVAPYIDHLETIMCGGDGSLANWVIDWLSDIFKNLDGSPPGSALILRGVKGAGKGLITYPLELLLGSHFVPVTGENEFLGQFNSHITRAIIIHANEAFWAGRKKAEGALKALITEITLLMNEKYLPAIKVKNYARVIMSSNENWVVPATMDERRFCVLNVSDERRGDTEYFNRMFKWCKHEENLAALLYFFQTRDITSNLRKPPVTAGLIEQIELSMDSAGKFWIDRLDAGTIAGGDHNNPDGFGGLVKSGEVYKQYIRFCQNTRELNPEAPNFLTKKLIGLCGAITSVRHTFSGSQARCLKLPTLDFCRDNYNTKVGISKFAV